MAEMDDVKNLEIAQINDENLRREREKLQAENPTREDIAPVDVKTDPGRTYFNEAPEQPAPQQAPQPAPQQTPPAPQKPAEDFSAPVAEGAPRIVSNGKDYTSRQIISAPVQGTNRARTTLYFGNESAMPQAFAQAAKQYNAPQSAEDRTSADYIASLNRTYSERRRQNGLRNDLIVTNAAAALLKQGFGDGETRRVMEGGALADINRSLEDAGATYRVTGMTMTKNEAGAPQFVVRTVDRNGKTHIHLRSAEEMYDVALAARRGLADQRGVRAPQSVDAKGNPTGEPDQYELANIDSWGDVRGTRKAWETRNADTIEKNKIVREKMDADRRLAVANILKQYDANALTKQNRGERLTEILKDTTKNAPLLATFGILKQKVGEDGKPAEDLNGNPIYEPNADNAQVQEGVARLRQMFGEEADRRSATADIGSWMKSLFPDLLGTPAQSAPAPAQSPASPAAAPAAAPAPTAGVTQAVSEHSADELKAALEARKAAQPAPETTSAPANPAPESAPAEAPAAAPAPAPAAEKPATENPAPVPEDTIRPPVAPNRPMQPRVSDDEKVENYRSASPTEDEWNEAAKTLGLGGFLRKDGEYVSPGIDVDNPYFNENVKRIRDLVVSRRRKKLVDMYGKDFVDAIDNPVKVGVSSGHDPNWLAAAYAAEDAEAKLAAYSAEDAEAKLAGERAAKEFEASVARDANLGIADDAKREADVREVRKANAERIREQNIRRAAKDAKKKKGGGIITG